MPETPVLYGPTVVLLLAVGRQRGSFQTPQPIVVYFPRFHILCMFLKQLGRFKGLWRLWPVTTSSYLFRLVTTANLL